VLVGPGVEREEPIDHQVVLSEYLGVHALAEAAKLVERILFRMIVGRRRR
jgi:hypothetical protein